MRINNNRIFNFVFYLIAREIHNKLPNTSKTSRFLTKKEGFSSFFQTSKYRRLPILLSFLSLGVKDSKEAKRKDAIMESDSLFSGDKFSEICQILSVFENDDDVEVLWRLARAKYKLSSQKDLKKEDSDKLVLDAFNLLQRALELDNSNFAVHKWMSVLLDAKSGLDGIKARISSLEKVKEHMLEAVKLNPKDATTFYMLGSWCYQIADMPWYQRKVAATVFAKPPESSYEEALEFFKKAEEIQPNFYNQNLLMLGKTYMKLGFLDEAKQFLRHATKYNVTTDDDKAAQIEAENLLKKLG